MSTLRELRAMVDEFHKLALKGPDDLLNPFELRRVGALRRNIKRELASLQASGSITDSLRLKINAAIDMEITSPRSAVAVEAVLRELR